MRVGDFSVEVVGTEGGAREVESGHVLARPGQVYTLRLRNHSPLRAVADISIDGRTVTGGGLVIDASSTVDLERPIHETERGRFTVIAEGDERVFGPDGGRDNPNLGLIEARFRRELPDAARERFRAPTYPTTVPRPIDTSPPDRSPQPEPNGPWRPGMPRFTRTLDDASVASLRSSGGGIRGTINALLAAASVFDKEMAPALPAEHTPIGDAIERAAGTGLTGSSRQDFVSVHVGQLEPEATVIRLRLVIGSEEALTAPRPLPESDSIPARPAARP